MGTVERGDLITGKKIRGGQTIIGLPSSGLHTNGYSLARKVLLETAGFAADLAFHHEILEALASIDPAQLSEANRIDYEILREQTERVLFLLTEVQEHRWNPTWYNPGDGIYNLLARDFDRMGVRRLPTQDAEGADFHQHTGVNHGHGRWCRNVTIRGPVMQRPDTRQHCKTQE